MKFAPLALQPAAQTWPPSCVREEHTTAMSVGLTLTGPQSLLSRETFLSWLRETFLPGGTDSLTLENTGNKSWPVVLLLVVRLLASAGRAQAMRVAS